MKENINPLRKERGGEFIFHHEPDEEFFLRLKICEREGDILLVWYRNEYQKQLWKISGVTLEKSE